MSPNPFEIDTYPPSQVARHVEFAGIARTYLSTVLTFNLTTPGGAFIAFGGMTDTVAVTGSEPVFGPTRLLPGIAFSLGLMLIVIGGAELFTQSNLITVARADRRVTKRYLLRNWLLVYLDPGNIADARIA